jgi:hypothetical protein
MLCVLSGNIFLKTINTPCEEINQKKIQGIICQQERGKHPEESTGFMKVPRSGGACFRWGVPGKRRGGAELHRYRNARAPLCPR